MPHQQAAALVALRKAIDVLLCRVAQNPEIITNPSHDDGRILAMFKNLSKANAGNFLTGKSNFPQTSGGT